jgi:hypothetical protein
MNLSDLNVLHYNVSYFNPLKPEIPNSNFGFDTEYAV